MISPDSGIHRPSFNGAPAKQTMNLRYVAECLLGSRLCARQRVRRECCIAQMRVHKAN